MSFQQGTGAAALMIACDTLRRALAGDADARHVIAAVLAVADPAAPFIGARGAAAITVATLRAICVPERGVIEDFRKSLRK